MPFLIAVMLTCVILAVAVVALVAIPARRQGRELLTPKGDEVVSKVRGMTASAIETARKKIGDDVDANRDKAADRTSSKNG